VLHREGAERLDSTRTPNLVLMFCSRLCQCGQMLQKCLIPLAAAVALWAPAAVEAFTKPSLTLPLRSSALRPRPRYASTLNSMSKSLDAPQAQKNKQHSRTQGLLQRSC
jgi:hypothetical protein